ncbi:MAG: hypothetical protein QM820_07880 [Minicystis sp.]
MTTQKRHWRALGALGVVVVSACAPEVVETPPQTPPQPASAAPAAPPRSAEPDTSAKVDELVGRMVAARGGLDKMKAIKTLRLAGRARFGYDGSFEVDCGSVQTRTGRVRNEITFQGITAVDAWDGEEAWSTDPFDGRRDPFKQSADRAKDLAQDADIDGPLVDWREKGHRVAYLGTEDIDGTLAHKLRVNLKDGDVEYHYLDPEAFLPIRILRETHVRGVERVTETDLGNYEQVAGVWMAFSLEMGSKGAPRSARYRFERAEANVAADDALFRFPAPGAKVTRAVVLDARAAISRSAAAAPAPAGAPVLDSSVISGLGARNIGSAAMSGRVSALAAHDDHGKTTVYVGAASGGVWKSKDGGTTFKPIFDKNPVQSIGAITVDPTRDETIWVGTGESWTRNSVSIGDGIYKSTDGGATWKNMGLPESERITRILVHPKNGDVVYACVPGKLWSDSPDRGVYKTEDGGKSWSLVLKGSNLATGCSGLAMDPGSPDVLLAGMWDFRRKGWTYRSGGEGPDAPSGSGLYRTADGGKTWTPVTAAANKGIPAGPWGRVEVVFAPSDPKIVYALIESKDSALYRSSDGGVTWEPRDKSQFMVWRPFYFARLIVDPQNPERVFKPDLRLIVSEDGGRSFAPCNGGAHGDWHDVWIDPRNPKHLIGGDDGGLWISHDGGNRWWKANNLPVSQFYHVSVDAKDPYQVYGGLQDNSTWVGPSAHPGGITNQRWENLFGGDGFWAIVDPTDPESVYVEYQGGNIARVDRRTHVARDIQPKAGYKEKLRFNWNTPIHASPTQKGTIYLGAQFLFRSKDRGDTWERISPDLSTNDPEKQKQEQSGGVTVDNSSAEMHTTIYAISESPRDPKVIWAGTDDGNLQLTRDGGKTWNNVVGNVPGLPKHSWVSWVEASRFDAGTAYAAFDRHTFGDMTPWVYKTTDHGQTWKRIVSPSQGVRGYAHVIKEDVVSPSLLFVGTEFGLWISTDGGARWAEFKGGDFPSVAVREIQVHPRDHDLVIATHGRGILDRRRPRPAARAHDRRARQGGRLPPGPARAAAHVGAGRLGRGRRQLRRAEPAERRGDHLLPARAPPLRPAQARGAGRQGQGRRHARRRRAPRDQPRRLVDAGEAAARPARRAGRLQRHPGPARPAGQVHDPADQGRGDHRDQARRRRGSARALQDRRSQGAVRRRDAGLRALRGDERDHRSHRGGAGRGRRSHQGFARGRFAGREAPRRGEEARRHAPQDRRHQGGRRHHRRGADPRAPRHALRRAHQLGREARALPARAPRRAAPRARRGRGAARHRRRAGPPAARRRPSRQEARSHPGRRRAARGPRGARGRPHDRAGGALSAPARRLRRRGERRGRGAARA